MSRKNLNEQQDDIVEAIDRAIEKPTDLQTALVFLEDLHTQIESRIDGIETDIENEK